MPKSAAILMGGMCLVASAAACEKTGTVANATGQATVTGQVIDLACHARNQANTGMDHDRGFACAQACVKWEGQPAGLLTPDGKVYQIAGILASNNNVKIAPHLAHTVTIAGDVSEKDGMLMLTATDVKMVEQTN
jgi:hypothetical protein